MDLLRGLRIPAWIVGIARGVLEAAILAGLAELALVLPGVLPQESVWLVIGVALIRAGEGWADNIDPAKKRT